MFYLVYDKSNKRVLNITVDCNEESLRSALPSEHDFIVVDRVPEYDRWRQFLVVEDSSVKVENKILTKEQEQEITNIQCQQEIAALKYELKETDFYTLRYIEGSLSEEKFKEKSAYRQGLRDRIKALEEKIKK